MITLELLGKEWGESVRDWTFRTILYNLVNLVLPPGSAVSENDVAAALGTSRTPVREAFIRLAQDGLLVVYPQKGTYVSLVDEHRVVGRVQAAHEERGTVDPSAGLRDLGGDGHAGRLVQPIVLVHDQVPVGVLDGGPGGRAQAELLLVEERDRHCPVFLAFLNPVLVKLLQGLHHEHDRARGRAS